MPITTISDKGWEKKKEGKVESKWKLLIRGRDRASERNLAPVYNTPTAMKNTKKEKKTHKTEKHEERRKETGRKEGRIKEGKKRITIKSWR